jgi:hypothetical protein
MRNFLSFYGETQFDMFPNPKRTSLAEHIYNKGYDVPVLKQAAIFGHNGAGKSNVIKGLEFIREFARNKDFVKNIEVEKFFYQLVPNPYASPIYLAAEFECGGQYFLYEIELSRMGVERETLSETFPCKGAIQSIFNRQAAQVTFDNDIRPDAAIGNAVKELLVKNPKSSLLALNREFPIISDARCSTAQKWLEEKLEIIGIHTTIPSLIHLLRENTNILTFVQKHISQLDVGVERLVLANEEFESWAKQHIVLANKLPSDMGRVKELSLSTNNTPILSINVEDGVRKVYCMIFDNMGKNGYVGSLDAASQSDGTLRALLLLPALYYAMNEGKTVAVDEINFCLSPSMVKGIVSFFANTPNTTGQFLFTTHDTQILEDKDILRSDEVWFVDKKEGASTLYSHNDFKEHHTMSMLRGYNEGRYGAIRFVNFGSNGE